MKQLASVFLLIGCVYANARQISPGEAMDFAADFMNSTQLQSAKASKTLIPKKAPGINTDAQMSPYYVFNRGEADGFVIISGDDRAPKILGYSDKGSFDADNLPPQLKAMMEQWATQMVKLPESAPQHASWNTTAKTRAGEGILMETAEWGQGYPYNALCPVIDGEQAPTGCTATAMAIVMKYHNWPETTQGLAYTNYLNREQTIDFSTTSIDWKSLNEPKESDSFKTAAASLNHMLGVAIDTHYTSIESVADIWPVGHRMTEFFKYSPNCQFIERKKFDNETWHDILRAQLDADSPVIYNGTSEDMYVGHAFVIDGYDNEGLYHVNWGWDGSCNGYYPIDGLIPDDRDFSQYAGMTINIVPDKSGKIYSRAFISNADVYSNELHDFNDYNFSVTEIVPEEPVIFQVPNITLPYLFKGWFGIAVADEEDNIVTKLFDDKMENLDYSYSLNRLESWDVCKNPGARPKWRDLTFPKLESGQRYQLVCYDVEDPEWRIVKGGIIHPSYFGSTGLNSVTCVVNLSWDENDPVAPWLIDLLRFKRHEGINKYYNLLGDDFPFNISVAGGYLDVDINSYTKDGTTIDPVYVFGQDNDHSHYGFNLTVQADLNDVILKWTPYANNRHDSGLEASKVYDIDGIVYCLEDDNLSLIGYENSNKSELTVPDYVELEGKKLAVTSLRYDALSSYNGLKHLTLGQHIEKVGPYALSNLPDLQTISVGGNVDFDTFSTMWTTGIECIYLLSTKKGEGNIYGLFNDFDWEEYFYNANKETDLYSADYRFRKDWWMPCKVYIPGTGRPNEIWSEVEMWTYAVDREHNAIMIKPIHDDIKINNIKVNGETFEANSDGVYAIPSVKDMEVTVNYILHDRREMVTVYDAAYNNDLPSQAISQSAGIINKDNGTMAIYTLEGVLITECKDQSTINSLTPGIYIVRRGGEMKKVVIR